MSDFGSLLSKLSETYAVLSSAEIKAAKEPGSFSAMAKVNSLRHMAKQLNDEWLEVSRRQQMEVCSYRMVASSGQGYSAKGVSQSLLDFQELFSQAYNAIKNGPTISTKLGALVQSETRLNLAYSFPGSLGFILTIPGESTLIDDKYDHAIDAIFTVFNSKTEDQIRKVGDEFGYAFIKKAYDWSRSNDSNCYGVDLNWTTSSGKRRGEYIEQSRFSHACDIILGTTDMSEDSVTVYGTLVGLDVNKRRFRLIELGDEGAEYHGILSENFTGKSSHKVPSVYKATITVRSVRKYSSGVVDETYILNSLDDGDGGPEFAGSH